MTGIYSIQVGDAAAKQWIQFSYEFTLNAMSNCQIALDGVSSVYATEFAVDKEILIYKSGVLKFRGIVIDHNSLSGGGIVLTCHGNESELTDDKAPMVGSAIVRVWTSTSDNTIIDTLVTSIAGWTTNVANSSSITVPSFRVSATESVWNTVIRLIEQTGKDIFVDQENKVIYLYDELTRSDKFSFIEGKNAKNINRAESKSKAGKVIVYGKGDGENQVTGSYGASTPVEVIIDRNILTDAEADDRAESAYDKLNPNPKQYSLNPITFPAALRLGDAGTIANNSGNINEEVDIVRMKITVDGIGTEKAVIEVTNPAYRLASKNNAEEIAKSDANYKDSQSSMQGSGNLSQWEGGINGNSSAGLKIKFYIGDKFVDEGGTMRVNSLSVDYDIDEYRRGVGTATESNKSPDIDSATASSDDNESTEPLSGETTTASGTLDDAWTTYWDLNNIGVHGQAIIFHIHVKVYEWDSPGGNSSVYARILHVDETDYYPRTNGLRLLRGIDESTETTDSSGHWHNPGSSGQFMLSATCGTWDSCNTGTDTQSHDHNVTVYPNLQGTCTIYVPIDPYLQDFDVQMDSTDSNGGNALASWFFAYYVISQHEHGSGTYKTDAHKHDVAVGDDVSDAGSVNATNVVVYLEFWNTATSAWDTKVTYTPSPAKTLEFNKDMTSGGTYPDAEGWWRIRIKTNHADPDYIQAVVSVKHGMDN